MPLTCEVRETLTIPDDAFNEDGIAPLLVTGTRYGAGHWLLLALPLHGPHEKEHVGEIFTEKDERPGMAVDTAYIWVNDACVKAGMRVAHFANRCDAYGPDEKPFFAAAFFLIDRRPAEGEKE
jgi:hypothetical protein